MDPNEVINYMGYLWYQVDGNTLTLGISEEGLEDFDDITKVSLPTESESVDPDEVCGELDTEDGPVNVYSPVEGRVVEVNPAVIENPELIHEDPYGDGWLFRVEADPSEIENLSVTANPDE